MSGNSVANSAARRSDLYRDIIQVLRAQQIASAQCHTTLRNTLTLGRRSEADTGEENTEIVVPLAETSHDNKPDWDCHHRGWILSLEKRSGIIES